MLQADSARHATSIVRTGLRNVIAVSFCAVALIVKGSLSELVVSDISATRLPAVVVSKRCHIIQRRIDPGIKELQDFVCMKGAVATPLAVGSQDFHFDEYSDR